MRRAQTRIPAALAEQAEELARQGKTPLFFGGEGRLLGVIAVADTIKEDSPDAIRQLREMGIRVVMLTGDNQQDRRGHRPAGRGGPGDCRGAARRQGERHPGP